VKVNKQALVVEVEEQNDEITFEELVDELPDSAPRFCVFSAGSWDLGVYTNCWC